ncbi:MAG: deoxyribodipyrimidine photo-lyase [Bacteroidota bacterium]
MDLNIMWFRRDLRLHDNAALYHALKDGLPLLPVFIFDKYILDDLEEKHDRRVEFIHAALQEMQQQLSEMGSSLQVYYGYPGEIFQQLLETHSIQKVFTNHDYEAYADKRDSAIKKILSDAGIAFHTYKDHVIFEKDEVVKDDGKPYTVFTPYSRKWKATLTPFHLKSYPAEKYFSNFFKQQPQTIPSLENIGFQPTKVTRENQQLIAFPSKQLQEEIVRKYHQQRNIPSMAGTSKMGVHLRFGTVSIRELARKAMALNETFLNELIWRDFYQVILFQFPHIGRGLAFKPAYDHIKWRNNETEFIAWCEGKTGYPIVDAGMRELNATGFMHNRVRMIVASFLTKHLLIDWRWGEAYFAKKLLDFDFASNNGGWQWAAGSGCDAAPYFRVFNPYLQTKKFDPELKYVRKWVPEFEEFTYPQPIVNHEFARKRVLETYAKALNQD